MGMFRITMGMFRMLTVSSSIAAGSGMLPKSVAIGSVILLEASVTDAQTYSWISLGIPEESRAVFRSPISQKTTFGPLDKVGVYQIQLRINEGSPNNASRILSFSVPGVRSVEPLPGDPEYLRTTGRCRNGSFVLPGGAPGYALYWDVNDSEGVLDQNAGIYRGRIIPTYFNPQSGAYAMAIGSDKGSDSIPTFNVGEIFEISQEIDFTGINILRLSIKFRE